MNEDPELDHRFRSLVRRGLAKYARNDACGSSFNYHWVWCAICGREAGSYHNGDGEWTEDVWFASDLIGRGHEYREENCQAPSYRHLTRHIKDKHPFEWDITKRRRK